MTNTTLCLFSALFLLLLPFSGSNAFAADLSPAAARVVRPADTIRFDSRPRSIEKLPYENVLIYKKSEYEKGNPYLYGSYHVDDWTLDAVLGAGSLSVSRLILQDGQLVPADPATVEGVTLPGDPAGYLIQVNQQSADRSVFSFDTPKALVPLRLEITPPPGTYNQTVRVKPSVEAGVDVFYRFAETEPWKAYAENAEDLNLFQSKTVYFYAAGNGYQTPEQTVEYLIEQPVSADSDGDGIPDALESAFNLPIFSLTKDYDQDNWDDLDELVRFSNPLDKTSIPANSDASGGTDLWSDFDEIPRGTSPTDPASQPVARNLHGGEYQLIALASDPLVRQNEPVENRTDSLLRAWNLTGGEIASATLSDSTWDLRLPGDDLIVLRAAKASSPNLVMLGLVEANDPPWQPELFYTGAESAEEWLNAVRNHVLENSFSVRTARIDAVSTAAVLVFEQWLKEELDVPLSFDGSNAELSMIELQSLVSQRQLAIQMATNILDKMNEQTKNVLVNLVDAANDAGASQAPLPATTDRLLRTLLYGEAYDPASLPASITADMIAQASETIRTLLDSLPRRTIQITGTVALNYGVVVLETSDGKRYEMDTNSVAVSPGSAITATGEILSVTGETTYPVLRVTQLVVNTPAIAVNNNDQDGDGLPDQWERFYFGRTDAAPDQDPDGDGATNQAELQRFTDPMDGRSVTRIADFLRYE